MLEVVVYFVLILFTTSILPGTFLSLIIIKDKTVDLLLFFIYVIVSGFFSQAVLALIFHITRWIPISTYNHFLLLSFLLCFLIILYFFTYRKSITLPVIKIDYYSVATLLITIIIASLLLNQFIHLNNSYFNPATDQYHWLTFGKEFLSSNISISRIFLSYSFYQPLFFLLLSPYQAFIVHGLESYQIFIASWIFLHYIFISLAISRLAFSYLMPSALGLLAPLILFSMHWFNYYLISTGVVPQNTGLLLFIIGLLIVKEKIGGWFPYIFLFLFYIIHFPTFLMFILIIGSAKILEEGYKFFFNKIIINRFKSSGWHLFEKLFFIPAIAVIFLYLIYLLNLIPYYKPELISYFDDYTKNYTLWSQPYTDNYHNIIINSAIIGALLLFFVSGDVIIAFGLLLPWAFLTTPLVAYHAFYASWQAFRYYLILYPSLTILAIYPLSIIYKIVEKLLSPNSGRAFIFLVVLFLVPFISNHVWRQQSYVFLDMITGRDGGVYNTYKKNEMLNIFMIKDFIKRENSHPIVLLSPVIDFNYISFVFAPRQVLILNEDICNELSCLLSNNLNFFEMKDVLALYNKRGPNKNIDINAIKRKFKHHDEFGDYILFQ